MKQTASSEKDIRLVRKACDRKCDARLDKNGSVTGYDYTATYYDYNGRAIQTKSTNHLGGYEKTYTAYNFTGQPVHTKHIHSKSNSELIEETKHSYNHCRNVCLKLYKS